MVWRELRLQAVNMAVCGVLSVGFALTGLMTGWPTRLFNVVVGCWLMLSAVVFPHATVASAWNQGIVGYVLTAFGFIPRRGTRESGPTAPVNW
jgi:hypothetical protein